MSSDSIPQKAASVTGSSTDALSPSSTRSLASTPGAKPSTQAVEATTAAYPSQAKNASARPASPPPSAEPAELIICPDSPVLASEEERKAAAEWVQQRMNAEGRNSGYGFTNGQSDASLKVSNAEQKANKDASKIGDQSLH